MVSIAASPGQLVIEPDDQFIVTNNSQNSGPPFAAPIQVGDRVVPFDWDGILRLTWNHRDYIIPPGEHRVVPFDAVRKHFGDPRSVRHIEQRYEDRDGNKGNIATRSQEVDRLCVLYGLYAGNESKLPSHPMVKDVVVETIDRVEIFCPAVDPEGLVAYAHRESNDRVQDTASMLALMERRLNQQQALIDQLRGTPETDADPDDDVIGVDTPRFPE